MAKIKLGEEVKIICVSRYKHHYSVTIGKVYNAHRTSLERDGKETLYGYTFENDCGYSQSIGENVGVVISLAEWRDRQINSIFEDD